jgi:hypothetical protein
MRCDDRPDFLLGIVVGAVGMLAVCWLNVPELRARVSRWVGSAGQPSDGVRELAIKNKKRIREV